MNIQKQLVDLMYGTSRVKNKYKDRNPDEEIYVADACKAIKTTQEKALKRGANWLGARRGVILLTNRKIICGNWEILIDDIQNAVLVKIGSFLQKGQVLKITTKRNEFFQFGMQENEEWEHQNVLQIRVEEGKLGYSLYSIVVRIILLVLITYWIIK